MSKRDEYVAEMKAKLDEWNAEIDELEAKSKQAEAQARQRYLERVTELKSKRDEGRAKLDEIQSASEQSWETLKTGAETIWGDIKKTLKETRDAFNEGKQG